MKSFVALFTVVAVVAADVSHLVRGPDADAVIVRQDADVFPDQYQYAYDTSNGIVGQESGVLKGDSEGVAVQGSNSYTAPNGERIETTYIADQFGYQPQGAHLPTPPPTQPIPEYIARSIQYNLDHPLPAESTKRF